MLVSRERPLDSRAWPRQRHVARAAPARQLLKCRASDTTQQLEPSGSSAWALWQEVRRKRPLVQCITNFVSMDIMANTLLAAGCSPAMAHSAEEVEAFVGISSALLVNMGTLSSDWVASMKLAAKQAVVLGKPWVLDPVGCGATGVRTRCCLELLECRPTLVRGNASEIMALAGAAGATTRGVDSTADGAAALPSAQDLARRYGCIVAVSGATDYVTDGRRTVCVDNGVALLTLVTAAGCSVTALAAAFLSTAMAAQAAPSRAGGGAAAAAGSQGQGAEASAGDASPSSPALMATAHAMAIFGLAAEESLRLAPLPGPGSLRAGLLDQLHLMSQHTVSQGCKIRSLETEEEGAVAA